MSDYMNIGFQDVTKRYRYEFVLNTYERNTLHDALKLYSNTIKNIPRSSSQTLNRENQLEVIRTKDLAVTFGFNDITTD